MPTILDSLASSFSPNVVGDIGKALGADTSAVSKGLGAVGPLAAVRHDETGKPARRRRIAHEARCPKAREVFLATSAAC